jgi:hypothetical protein
MDRVLEKGSPERLAALERGFTVALRDNQLPQAESFAALLKSEGHSEFRSMLGQASKVDDEAFIPGGRDALAFMANAPKGVPAEKFFDEFARVLVTNVCTGACSGDEYSANVQRFFDDVAALEAAGKRDGHRFLITLSLNGEAERNRTETILHLLGLELHSEKGVIRLDQGGRRSQAKKQEVVSALAIDEVGMQESLQAGKPFTFEIVNESAAIYPSAKLWWDWFPNSGHEPFAQALLHSPQMARLYVSLSGIDRHTIQALLSATNLSELSTKFGDPLARFGTSFAFQNAHAAVPGGVAAEPLWAALAGAGPQNAGTFFRALLEKPDLLAYFYALSQLDARHQAFFTASVERARRFYLLFTSLSAPQGMHKDLTVDTSIAELLRSVPLDDQGHVAFPGSPEIWEVVNGRASNYKNVAKLMEKASKTAAPDVEDSILVRLAGTDHKTGEIERSELDNFLAVSRIDMHRREPLDEESALLLAQHYSDSWEAYPYFSDIPAINLAGFHSFFDVIDRIRQHSELEQNLELGQLHSLLAWVSILNRRHALQDAEAARLFAQICNALGTPADEGRRSSALLSLVSAILTSCSQDHPVSWSETLRSCLLGPSLPADSPRVQDYELTLNMQKVPDLEALHSIGNAVAGILKNSASGSDSVSDATYASAIVKAAASLSSVPIPKHSNVTGHEKDAIEAFDPEEVQKKASELTQVAGRQKANPKAAQKAAEDLLKALEPQITAALAGPIYAYYLRSSDLVISEDPLLLRKHRYFDFASSSDHHRLMTEADFVPSSEGVGSYFVGGFAQFGLAAGRAAGAGWRQGGSGANAMIAAQIAAIRAAEWDRLVESDQRLVSLRILAAREWIVQSGSDPEYFRLLSEATSGLLSLSRRADLLNGIEDREWQLVWESTTLPDLFLLGKAYPAIRSKQPDLSPVASELRLVTATNDGSRLDIFARIPYQVLGCSHPHMMIDAPYEEYERRLDPEDLAERAADFKLYLAYRADSLGIEPADAGSVAERLAGKAFRDSQLSGYHDWRSLLAAYESITGNDLRKALEP